MGAAPNCGFRDWSRERDVGQAVLRWLSASLFIQSETLAHRMVPPTFRAARKALTKVRSEPRLKNHWSLHYAQHLEPVEPHLQPHLSSSLACSMCSSLQLASLCVCSSPWWMCHSPGISSILGSSFKLRLLLDFFMKWLHMTDFPARNPTLTHIGWPQQL